MEHFHSFASGISLFILIGCCCVGAIGILVTMSSAIDSSKTLRRHFPLTRRLCTPLLNIFISCTSCAALGALLETSLSIFESIGNQASLGTELAQSMVLPTELQRRDVEVAGSDVSFYWQGKLHVNKYEGFRRSSEFPTKSEGVFRIMVVGDSLTYGEGIDQKDTYSQLMQDALSEQFNVEVLNLGVMGFQTSDILRVILKWLPILKPDLVVYGVCLNDFLPSAVGQYENNRVYSIPIPFKEHFIKETRLGALLAQRYDRLLIKLGIRNDFWRDILKDFRQYRTRFSQDVKSMNEFVISQHLPPMVGMVLNQYPCDGCPGDEVSKHAERYMTEAGFTVIPASYASDPSIKGTQLHVNAWEGHPNERANEIFAQFFVRTIRQLPILQAYAKRM